MKTGNRRAAMGFTVRDVAEAAGVGYRTCLLHEKAGLGIYGDLGSVARYIAGKTTAMPASDTKNERDGEFRG